MQRFIISKILKKILHPSAIRDSIVDKNAKICTGTYFLKSKIEKYSYVGNFCTVVNTSIGKFTSIGDDCLIGSANHPISWGSTSPVFHEGRNILKKNFSKFEFTTSLDTIIGNDVWIGSRVLIKNGVKIGDGVVIGMGSVVTKDIEPYSIVAGVPAKVIRKRFDDKIIDQFMNVKWWELSDERLEEISQHIRDPHLFIDSI